MWRRLQTDSRIVVNVFTAETNIIRAARPVRCTPGRRSFRSYEMIALQRGEVKTRHPPGRVSVWLFCGRHTFRELLHHRFHTWILKINLYGADTRFHRNCDVPVHLGTIHRDTVRFVRTPDAARRNLHDLFPGGYNIWKVVLAFARVWFGVACMVMLACLSGAPAELGENLSTTQSAGTEIWQVFVLSTNTFHPSGAAATNTVDATSVVDAKRTAAINGIAFVFIISPLRALTSINRDDQCFPLPLHA